MIQLNENEYPKYYDKYFPLLFDSGLIDNLNLSQKMLLEICGNLSDEKWNYKYAEGKWSVKNVVNHITDCERIFQYRAVCIARGEKNMLPGFEENDYAAASNADKRSGESLLNESNAVRQSSILLYGSFDEEQLMKIGNANNWAVSVRAIGWMLSAHQIHHLNVIKERYL